jgi:hypothetical protein
MFVQSGGLVVDESPEAGRSSYSLAATRTPTANLCWAPSESKTYSVVTHIKMTTHIDRENLLSMCSKEATVLLCDLYNLDD